LRAISKLVAMVILVSVTVAISIGLALYMSGLVGGLTSYERLDIVAGYAMIVTDKFGNQNFQLVLNIVNRGTTEATIDSIFINDKPINAYGGTVIVNPNPPFSIKQGEKTTIQITLSPDTFHHGQMIKVEIHTATGGKYTKLVTLP